MADNSTEVVCRYLEEAVAAETRSEAQLHEAAGQGDDEEVRAVFRRLADAARLQRQQLIERLQQLGGRPSEAKTFLDRVLNWAPKLAEAGHMQEEQTLQNLIVAFTMRKGECAMYEALAVTAEAARDAATAAFARQSQKEEAAAAEEIRRFLPSRSKIAFNMLTVAEVDPAIETKAATNRVV